MAIKECKVEHSRGKAPRRIKRVFVTFGSGFHVDLRDEGGKAVLHMGNGRVAVTLDASGPHSAFERAINLLRLHLPGPSETTKPTGAAARSPAGGPGAGGPSADHLWDNVRRHGSGPA